MPFWTGTVGIIWFLLWSLLTASCPEEHKTISKAELEYIIKSRGGEKKEVNNLHITNLQND